MISQNIAGRNRLAHFGVVLGLGAALTAAACSGSGNPAGRNPAGPSAVEAPASVDHASGGEGSHKHFTIALAPTTVTANQTGVVLAVTVTNCGAATPGCTDGSSSTSGNSGVLGTVEIVVPAGLTVTNVSDPSGAFAELWSSGQTVIVGGPAGGDRLAPGASTTFNITVDTPSVCGPLPFQTPRGAQATTGDLPHDEADWNFDFYPQPSTSGLSVEVTGCTTEEECPAAPSIAARYLHFVLGIQPNTDQHRNIVAQVTEEMGPGNDFQGLDKCDPGYDDAVIAFVNGLLP